MPFQKGSTDLPRFGQGRKFPLLLCANRKHREACIFPFISTAALTRLGQGKPVTHHRLFLGDHCDIFSVPLSCLIQYSLKLDRCQYSRQSPHPGQWPRAISWWRTQQHQHSLLQTGIFKAGRSLLCASHGHNPDYFQVKLNTNSLCVLLPWDVALTLTGNIKDKENTTGSPWRDHYEMVMRELKQCTDLLCSGIQ